MILSYHPICTGDINRLYTNQPPTGEEMALMKQASAIILPQGVRSLFYHTAKENCAHVFPNYDARFTYPGKIGQARLFEAYDLPHPQTVLFESARPFTQLLISFPMVLKYDWGGEGQTVFLISDEDTLEKEIGRIRQFEKNGESFPFLLQPYIPHNSRTLRCVVIYDNITSYWRVSSPEKFGTAISDGAVLDKTSDMPLQEKGIELVKKACAATGINLAGFDLLFPEDGSIPVFLEINYYFGRNGLGGADVYYTLLTQAITKWLRSLELAPCSKGEENVF